MTTVLTMVNLKIKAKLNLKVSYNRLNLKVTFIWSTNASLPKISYVKGIDVYLVYCFIMTFCSVIEFGIVSFLHRRVERKKRKKSQTTAIPAMPALPAKPSQVVTKKRNNLQKVILVPQNRAIPDLETHVDQIRCLIN
jgi:hypothetical protein